MALLLSSHPPLTLLLIVVPTVFGIGQVVATPLVFAFAGVILLGFVLGYSGLGRRIRHPGGLYVQVASGLGRSVGLGAAAVLFVSYAGLVAGIYGLAAYILKGLIFVTLGMDLPLALTLVISIVAVQRLSFAPIRKFARILTILLSIQFMALLLVAVCTFDSPAGGTVSLEGLNPGSLLSGSFIVALIFALTGFIGSEGATAYSDELINPGKSIPKATYFSYALTTALLVVGSWAISGAVGAEAVVTPTGANPLTILAHLSGLASNGGVQRLLFIAVYTGIISTAVTMNHANARQLAGLARDGVLAPFLAATSSAPPARPALMVQPISAGVIALVATFSATTAVPLWLAVTSGLGVLLVLTLASAAAAVWFMRGEADESGFLGWEGRVVAAVFSVLTIGSVFIYGVTHIEQVAPGSPDRARWMVGTLLAITFAGGILAAQYLRVRRPAVYASIGGARVDDERLVAPPVSSVAK